MNVPSRSRRLAAGLLCASLAGGLLLATPSPGYAASKPRPAPVTLLLPRLVVLASPDLYLGTPTSPPQLVGTFPYQEVLYGCTPYEAVVEGAQICLRYDGIVANVGAGPLQLSWQATEVPYGRATQWIKRSDGSWAQRSAGSVYFDPAYGWYHYTDSAVAYLWRARQVRYFGPGRSVHYRWQRYGSRPAAAGQKDGYCFDDTAEVSPSSAAPRTYTFPDACYPTPHCATATVPPACAASQVSGISVGWADEYDLTLTNQYVNISSPTVSDGYYFLQITVDPLHTFLVAANSQESSWQLVEICDHKTKADLVGLTHNCG